MTGSTLLCYIGGERCRGGGGLLEAVNPATGEVLAEVSEADVSDVEVAVRAAQTAQHHWARASAFERAAVCEAIATEIAREREVLARALTEDQGKPFYSESFNEVDELVLYFEMAAEDARRLEGLLSHSSSAERRVAIHRVPLGVVGVVTPWNWPYTTGAQIIAPALAAGKAMILELGGTGPMVVLDDADLDLAAAAALEAAFLCAGQSCTAGERVLVHAAVRSEFVERVVALTGKEVRLGDPFDERTTMGALNNEATAAKFDRHVADARARGARICHGGARSKGWPTDLSPSRQFSTAWVPTW